MEKKKAPQPEQLYSGVYFSEAGRSGAFASQRGCSVSARESFGLNALPVAEPWHKLGLQFNLPTVGWREIKGRERENL